MLFYFQEDGYCNLCICFFFINLIILCCLTVKAKTVEEVIKNRPAAGILDRALAKEYRVIFNAFVNCV